MTWGNTFEDLFYLCVCVSVYVCVRTHKYVCMLRPEKGFESPGTVAIGIYEAFSAGVENQIPVLCKSVKGS